MTVSLPEARYTMPKVARIIGCHRTHVYVLMKRGELHAERDEGNQLRISRDEVAGYIKTKDRK